MNIKKSYETLPPPYPLNYENWSSDRAQAYLEWFVSHIQERVDYILAQCKIKKELSAGDMLLDVWKWFLHIGKVEKVPPQELTADRLQFAQFGDAFISHVRLTTETEYILRDIAMLLSRCFLENYPSLYWGFDEKPNRYLFRNRPVIKGFLDQRYAPPFPSVFEPVHMVGVQATKLLDQTAKAEDLQNLFRQWEKMIP